jgi:myo-inositol-1(or 4)-monophosphatase
MTGALGATDRPPQPGRGAWVADDHALLCRAVREAGRIASRFFYGGTKGWDKRPGHPVSKADLAVDAYLKETLLSARPDYGWLSEESGESKNRLAAERIWVVDPIDGTRGFLMHRPEYAVSVALVAGECPVAGALFNPETDEFFEATAGGGARCNGAVLKVADTSALSAMKVVVSRRERRRLLKLPELCEGEVRGISSIAYKIALVATGRADVVVSFKPKSDWDLAAAHLLVTEAGGRITGMDGSPIRFNRPHPRHDDLLAANPALHALLVEFLGRR